MAGFLCKNIITPTPANGHTHATTVYKLLPPGKLRCFVRRRTTIVVQLLCAHFCAINFPPGKPGKRSQKASRWGGERNRSSVRRTTHFHCQVKCFTCAVKWVNYYMQYVVLVPTHHKHNVVPRIDPRSVERYIENVFIVPLLFPPGVSTWTWFGLPDERIDSVKSIFLNCPIYMRTCTCFADAFVGLLSPPF